MIEKLEIPTNILTKEGKLKIDFYHGSSTIFLNSIIKNGLGGINPIEEWKILELSNEVYKLSEKHLKDTVLFIAKSKSYKLMIEQSNNGNFNFQHGDTYITPSKQTAIRYAINNTYGSELLSRTIEFLKKLIALRIDYVTKDLFRKYSEVFNIIEANPSPILLKIKNIDPQLLSNEYGKEPGENYKQISKILESSPDHIDLYLQQINFRLNSTIGINNLEKYLINVTKWQHFIPEYNLFIIETI